MSSPTQDAPSAAPEDEPKRSLMRNPYFWAAAVGLLTITAVRPFMRNIPSPPPILGALPEGLTLHDHQETPVTTAELRGAPMILNLFYSDCGEPCELTQRAALNVSARLQSEGGQQVHVVSVSVDPGEDSASLSAYRARFAAEGADESRWRTLRADEQTIAKLTTESFSLTYGVSSSEHDAARLTSGFIALVDADGNLRGYYDHGKSGRDELYHRALHAFDAAQAQRPR